MSTRPHRDLDVAVRHYDVLALRAVLAAHGFEDVPRDDTRECSFVLGDDRGRELDVHSFGHDDDGNLTFGMNYPRGSLTGTGTIAGESVDCISPEWMVRFHSGYELDVDAFRDVAALCALLDQASCRVLALRHLLSRCGRRGSVWGGVRERGRSGREGRRRRPRSRRGAAPHAVGAHHLSATSCS